MTERHEKIAERIVENEGPEARRYLKAEIIKALDESAAKIDWQSAESKRPKCDMRPNRHGIPVLIWPYSHPNMGDELVHLAFYGTRVQDAGGFYLYGAVIHPTHWAYLPGGPDK